MAIDKTPSFGIHEIFAGSDTKTIFLFPADAQHPHGVWITFKTELDYGEDLAVMSALFKGMSYEEKQAAVTASEKAGTSTIIVDLGRQKLVKLATWIHDWNLPGRDGKTIKWPQDVAERFTVLSSLNKKVAEWLEARVDEIVEEYSAVKSSDPDDDEATKNPLVLLGGGGEPARTP